jgi:acyl carrier protein
MNQAQIQDWLVEKISEETGLNKDQVKIDVPFDSFNLDSLSMITVSFDLETILGREIDPTLFYQYNSIRLLSEAIQSNPND